MQDREHDLIVIGAGPGGYVAAIRAAQLGLDVACVEKEGLLGGTCLRVGCIPSKALLESSERYEEASNGFEEHGVATEGAALDLRAMLKRKGRIVQTLAKGIEGLFRKNGIQQYSGRGRLDGPGRVVVEDGERTELEATSILIATGSRPATLPGVEADGKRIGTSEHALSWSEVPGRLAVIGAGYIGLELGSVWRRLGAKVTVFEYLARILPGTDEEIAKEAFRALKKQGLDFQLGAKVSAASIDGDECVLECEGLDPHRCDRILVAAGRVPNTEGLGLESAGVGLNERGQIPVSEGYETSAKGIYAIGDVIAGPMLAHKAEEEGVAFAERLVTGYGHVDYGVIPSVAYSNPQIAAVGKTEEALAEDGVEFRKGIFPFAANGRARCHGITDGRVKILADAKTDRILGVHIIGPNAEALIGEAALAMEYKASSEDLARTIHAHPTLSEALKEAALAVDDRAIHI